MPKRIHLFYRMVMVPCDRGGLVFGWLVRRARRPWNRLPATAAEIAVTKDHSRRLTPRKHADEIGRLARTINGMLQALEGSFQEVQKGNKLQRHFLIDVSHELRTPLTIMLSSLDLMKKVGATDPEFQVSALERVRGEAERMARMVTQLLVLARSDANVTTAYEPVLIRDLVADLSSQRQPSTRELTLECRGMEQQQRTL